MAYVNKSDVMKVYAEVNGALGIEGDPLFVENYEELVLLITSAFSGQANSGAAEARTRTLKQYQGITVVEDDELIDEENDDMGAEEGDSGETQIVNTPDPRPDANMEDEAQHGGEGDKKGGGKDGEGKTADGEPEGGKGKGKGKSGKGKGKGKGQGEGDSDEQGDEQQGQGSGDGDEESEQQAENNSAEEQQNQSMQPNQQPQPEQPIEEMDDNAMNAYEFKFQRLTKLFFGAAMSHDLWVNDNGTFKELENLLKTGLGIAIHDNVLKNYSDYPERELMIRKKRAVDLLGRFSLLMTTDFLAISDSEGRPNDKRQGYDRSKMEMFIASDKIAERLLPLFFIFRKELFGKERLAQYIKFCLLFLHRKQRFLRIDDWFSPALETVSYDFYDMKVISMGQQSATVFKKYFDTETGERSFKEKDAYRIEEGKLVSSMDDRRLTMDLQLFVRDLISFYLSNDKAKIEDAIANYTVLSFKAEFITSYEMVNMMKDLALIKRIV